MREIFISVDVIKDAIDSSDSVTQIVKTVAKSISDASGNIFDLQFTSGASNTELSVIDRNLLYVSNKFDDESDTFAQDLFTFKPHSPNSIVKSSSPNV